MSTDFSAASPDLGYLYQTLYALLLLLKSKEEAVLALETLDDVVFEKEGNGWELLQLKHHRNNTANLTDASPDLWKTLRIWSSQLLDGKLSLSETVLSLITTAKAPEGSIAAQLKPDNRNRDVKDISSRLLDIAQTSNNKNLQESFSAFLALSKIQRDELISSIHILDGSPKILEVPVEIKNLLMGVRYKYRESVYERLEGWWFDLAINHLYSRSEKMVSKKQVEDKIASINEQFLPDALPIDFLGTYPPSPSDVSSDCRNFVLQLKAIMVNDRRIEKAIIDYYRAFQQRSKWVREDLLEDDELEKYELKLIEEWEGFCLANMDKPDYDDSTEEKCILFGKNIYYWVDRIANIPIRPRVNEEYVTRGSYHILADQNPPRVWWHPKFIERLEQLLKTS